MRIAVVFLTLFATQALGQMFDFRHAADDPEVLALLQDLAVRGANQPGDLEVAAFIVLKADGGVSCLLWPHSANMRSEHYQGRIPEGTVAIAHTHPLYAPQASGGDVAQSKRIGLPIYVLTRWNLSVVDPSSGERVALIERKSWIRSMGKRSTCKTGWSNAAVAQRADGNSSVVMKVSGSSDH